MDTLPGRAARRRLGAPPRAAASLAAVVTLAVLGASGAAPGALTVPGPVPWRDGGRQQGAPAAGGAAQLRGIILPDLLVVVPTGISAEQVGRLRAITGVRAVLAIDGARVRVAGRQASVVGVSPGRFRSWVPLPVASDQRLWTALASGRLVASRAAALRLGLRPGSSYRLAGGAVLRAAYAGSAAFGIAGIDLVVDQAMSRRLGLVPRVAVLISAPGPAITALLARVRAVLGRRAGIVVLRRPRLPAAPARPGPITGYLQLFRASAARYCPALSWTVLAAIGQIESGDGQNMGPSPAGALGPMQFLPATWAAWGIDGFGPSGPPDIMNPLDAVPSAARMLCADGAASGTLAGLRQAIFAYNHATWYVSQVLALAARYAAEYR